MSSKKDDVFSGLVSFESKPSRPKTLGSMQNSGGASTSTNNAAAFGDLDKMFSSSSTASSNSATRPLHAATTGSSRSTTPDPLAGIQFSSQPNFKAPASSNGSKTTTTATKDAFADLLGDVGGIGKKPTTLADIKASSNVTVPPQRPQNASHQSSTAGVVWNFDLLGDALSSQPGSSVSSSPAQRATPNISPAPFPQPSSQTFVATTATPPNHLHDDPFAIFNAPPVKQPAATKIDEDPLAIFNQPPPKTQPAQPSMPSSSNLTSAPAPTPSTIPSEPSASSKSTSKDTQIAQMVEMGYDIKEARNALEIADWNIQKAIDIITENRRAADSLRQRQTLVEQEDRLSRMQRDDYDEDEFEGSHKYDNLDFDYSASEDMSNGSSSTSKMDELGMKALNKAAGLFALGKARVQNAINKAAQSDFVKKAIETAKQNIPSSGSSSHPGHAGHTASDMRSGESSNWAPFRDTHDTQPPSQPHQRIPSTSISVPSAAPAPIATPSPQQPPKPARPEVKASPEQIATADAHKERGNQFFKAGQFADAEACYTQAIESLPTGHLNLIALYNNRAAARLKTGDNRGVIADCSYVRELDSEDLKSLLRRANAYEAMEKWEDAQRDYREIMSKDSSVKGVSLGLQRCAKALSIQSKGGDALFEASGSTETKPRPEPAAAPSKQSDLSLFDPTFMVSQTTTSATSLPGGGLFDPVGGTTKVDVDNSDAVAEFREVERVKEMEKAQAFAMKDHIDDKVNAWRSGKEDNLRTLLATLNMILWPELGLDNINMADLIQPNKVKIRYMKAIAKVHPDKISKDEPLEHRLLASAVFSSLNKAWDAFKIQNNL